MRESPDLEQLHWSTNRLSSFPSLAVLAIDHRSQLEELAQEAQADPARIDRFKMLALEALRRVAGKRAGFGLLADGRFGMRALETAADLPFWIGRPIELPGSRPLQFEGGDNVMATLLTWPIDHVVKCLVFYHPDDPEELRRTQDQQLIRLFHACRATRHELLLEVIASRHGEIRADTIARVIEHIYDLGIFPDWWKLEPSGDRSAWHNIESMILSRDPHCRGIVLLGLSAPKSELLESFACAAESGLVKGFAVGRTIWQEPALCWLLNKCDDETAVEALAENFAELVDGWRSASDLRANAA